MSRLLPFPLLVPLLPALALSPAGCAVPLGLQDDDATGDDDASAGDDDDDDDDDAVEIDSIVPDEGPVGGGNAVEIHGHGLAGSGLEVWFGDQSAAITAIAADRVVVTAPPAESPSWVDVRVACDDGEDTVADGYQYQWSGVGLDGGRVTLIHMEEPAFGTQLAQAQVRLYVPDDYDFLDHLPANGACGYNIAAPTVFYDYLDAGSTVSLRTFQGSIPLSQATDASGGPYYESLGVPPATVLFSGTYGLDLPGGDGLPAMSIEQVMQAGADFVVYVPDLSAPVMTVWHRDPGAVLQWTTGGDAASRMLIQLISIDEQGNPTGGNLTCTSNDGGGFVFGDVELAYLDNGINALYVSRYDISEWQNPYNGSTGHGVFAVTKVGTILLVD